MATTLDLMEYSSDVLARAAYVTDDAGSNVYNLAQSNIGSGFQNLTIRSIVSAAGLGDTVHGRFRVLFKAGTSNDLIIISAYLGESAGGASPQNFKTSPAKVQLLFSGNAGVTITASGTQWSDWVSFTTDGTVDLLVSIATGNNNYISGKSSGAYGAGYKSGNNAATDEVTGYTWQAGYSYIVYQVESTSTLNCFSESSIKTQGSYSLKGVATTSALNKTLTRTIGSPIDLTGVDILKFDIRSTRTGSNIKIGIHDSGGTTTEVTPNITDANTWQLVVWDISAVANADKDAIDSIIVTIANADSANTFYIDNFLSAEDVTVTAEPIIVTTAMSSSGAVIFLGYGYVYEESSSGEAMDVSARTKASVGNTLLKRKNLKYIYHMMNTHGKDVTMTIYIDGTAHSHTFTINTTTRKMRRIEDVPNMEGHKFDVKLSCDDVTDTDLEIYAPIALHHTTYGE